MASVSHLSHFVPFASGTDDFGVAGAGNLLLARAQGVPVVAIGAEFQNTPVGFIVHAGSGIHSFQDFRGKRVGVQTGADTDVLYRALLSTNHMTTQDVHEVPIQFDATPFTTGRVDVLPGYVTNQPVTLRGKGIAVELHNAEITVASGDGKAGRYEIKIGEVRLPPVDLILASHIIYYFRDSGRRRTRKRKPTRRAAWALREVTVLWLKGLMLPWLKSIVFVGCSPA